MPSKMVLSQHRVPPNPVYHHVPCYIRYIAHYPYSSKDLLRPYLELFFGALLTFSEGIWSRVYSYLKIMIPVIHIIYIIIYI